MEQLLLELARNIPAAAAVISTVWIMSHFENLRDLRREDNAKKKGEEQHEHEVKIQKMWQVTFNLMNAKTDETFRLIDEKLEGHEKAEEKRYEKMNITQDLINTVKERVDKDRQ